MKPYTVNELLGELKKLQTRGYGEHIILVSDDEECNGYHPLFGAFLREGETIEYLDEHTNKMETGKTILID